MILERCMKDGGTAFEFVPRERKSKKGPKEPEPKIDFTGLQPIGKCPVCGSNVFETPTGYVCEKTQAEKKSCKFKKIGKEILQRPITVEQVQKLLAKGKTDLLDKFISKAGKPFSAYLVLDENGKVGFDFPPRDLEVPAGNT